MYLAVRPSIRDTPTPSMRRRPRRGPGSCPAAAKVCAVSKADVVLTRPTATRRVPGPALDPQQHSGDGRERRLAFWGRERGDSGDGIEEILDERHCCFRRRRSRSSPSVSAPSHRRRYPRSPHSRRSPCSRRRPPLPPPNSPAPPAPPFRAARRPDFSWKRHFTPPPSPLHTLAPSPSYLLLPSSIPRVSLCRAFPPGGAGSGTPHPPITKPCVILFTNPSNVPQAEEDTRRLLSLARETRPQQPLSSVRPSQPPAASSRCGSLPSGKSCRWDGMSSRCCRRGVWAIGQHD